MLQVQVAFQGGGARVSDLLSVVETLQDFERKALLKVNRVAGTSAGALAAAVAACGPGAAASVKQYIQANAKGITKALAGNSTGEIKLRTLGKAWRAWTGEPLIETNTLRNVITNCFCEAWQTGLNAKNIDRSDERWSKNSWTLGDLWELSGIELIVISTDIVAKKPMLYSSREINLIDALINSVAIPFVFRGFRALSSAPFVDGGLCENMPSDALIGSEAKNGQVLAVSFSSDAIESQKSGMTPESSLEFIGSLIGAAVNSNVNRSVLKLPPQNVLKLKSSNTTFDFARAFVGNNNGIEPSVVSQTQSWLSAIVRRPPPPPPISELFEHSTSNIWKWYLASQKHVRRRNIRSVMIARADSCRANEHGVIDADSITKEYHVVPLNDRLSMFHVSIGTDPFTDVRFDVTGPDGALLSFGSVPCADLSYDEFGKKADARYGYLLLFDEPWALLTPDQLSANKFYRVRARYRHQGGLSGLVQPDRSYCDSISHSNRRAEEYENVDVVVKVPSAMKLKALAVWGAMDAKTEEIEKPLIADTIGADELNDYLDDYDWHCYGWRVKRLAPGRAIKVDLQVRRSPGNVN